MKKKKAREEANTFKVADGKITSGDNDMNARFADALLERAANIRKEADEIASSLNRLSEAYTSTTQKAQAEQKKEEESTNKTLDAIRAKEDELKKLNEQVELMEAHHANGWGGDFFASMRKGENPLNAIKDYFAEGDAIKEKQQQIADITAELEKLRTAADETKTSTTDIWSGMSKSDIATTIQENIAQLKILKSEYSEIAQVYGKDSDKAKENKEKQEEITREIIQGKEKLREMGTSYEDVSKAAKKAAKNTEEIGDKAKESTGKIGGIIAKLKSFFTKGFSLDSILGMVFSPKGATLAGITAVAGGMKWLSQQAESLRVAMGPLKTYLDEGVLEDLRQQFVALEYQSSHSAEEMAAAGTRWVKYFEGLRGNANAISEVTKSSNDFATVLGSTSEKAADYQLKIAGAYHQTAAEAKDNSTIIINASKRSTAKYEEMAQALASSANRAQNAGISFKELAAATAYGSSTFGSASEAASTYVMMMTRLAAQSKNEYNPAVVGATKALENLSKSNELNNTLTSLLGKRQASLAKVFVQNAIAIAKMKDGLDDEASAAAAVEAAEGKVENVEKRLQNAKKALAHEVNTNLTPAYVGFINTCIEVVKGVGNISSKIKSGLSSTLSFINTIDNAIKESTIYKLFGGGAAIETKGNDKYNITKGMNKYLDSLDENSWWDNHFNKYGVSVKQNREERREKLKQQLAEIYKKNLKQYGELSPGKAMLATLNAYNHSNIFDGNRNLYTGKQISQMVAEMMNATRALNSARTTGENLSIGKQNSVTDNSRENKLKQLQEQQRKYREEEAEREAKELASIEKTKWDIYVAEQENGISKMTDANEKENARRKLDFEKKKHEIEEERKAMLEANTQTAKALYEKNPDNKGKEGFYASGLDKNVKLTAEQQKYIQTKKDTLLVENAESERKYLREQLQYYYDYLKEFGSIQEQKYAIAKEYDEKIAKATSPNQRKLLEEQKKSSLANVELEAVKQNIDWGSVFGDFGTMFKDQLEPTIKSLKQLASKTENVDEKKTIWELVSKLQKTGTLWDSDIFVTISNDLKTYQEAMRSYAEAQKKEQKVADELTEAEERLKNAQKSGNEKDILDASATVDKLKNQMSEAADATKGNKDAVVKATTDLQTSSQRAINQFQQLESCLSGLTSGTLKGIGDALMGLDKLFGGKATDKAASSLVKMTTELFGSNSKLSKTLTKVLGESGMTGEIVSAALGILDILKDGAENLVSSLIDTILGAVNGLIKTALSPKTVTGILKSVFDGVTSIFDTLSFGTISNIFGDNSAKMESKIDKLNTSNEALKMSIDNLRDKIEKSNSLSEILNAQNKKEKQTKELEQNTSKQMIYETWKHGAWRSNLAASVEDNKGWKDAMKQVSAILGKKVKTSGDFLSLSAEEMQRIIDSDNGAELWAKILNEYNKEGGKGGRSDKLSDMLNQYVNDFGNVAQDMADEIKEKLNGISFDSMKDSFISALMDMDKNAEDFASDFSKIMQQALLNLSVDELINGSENNPNGDSLKKLYDDMAEAMKNETYKSRAEEFAQRQQKLLEQGMKMRDELAQFTGYGEQSSQSATGKAIEAITADQASTLIGIGYAMQSAMEQGNEMRKLISADIGYIRLSTETLSNNISEMRDAQYQGLQQLQAINKNTYNLFQIKDDIYELKKIAKDRW